MAVSKVRRMPNTPRTLWEMVAELQREFKEFRAQKTLEQSSIGAGGLTVQDPTEPERIVLTPQGARTVSGGAKPPAVEFYSGIPEEIAPGQAMGYSAPAAFGNVPAFAVVTGDLGAGFAYLEIQAGNALGDTPALSLALGTTMALNISGEVFLLLLGTTEIAMDNTGVYFPNEGWTGLSLSNGWTAAGGTWQTPEVNRQIDNTVQLIGSAAPGTLTSGTVIATLPTNYIPPGDMEYRVPGGSSSSACDLVVHGTSSGTPGTITITNIAGTITRLSLSTIRFSL